MGDIEKLVEHLEKDLNVIPLNIKNVGSRAWNMDNPSSDKDMRVIYAQPLNKYIHIQGYKDSFEFSTEIDGVETDVSGWNIKKFLKLIHESNPAAIEYLKSYITYYRNRSVNEVFSTLSEEIEDEFNCLALVMHYNGLAKNNFYKYIDKDKDVNAKRYSYILRGLFYSKYVEKTGRIPVMNYQYFVDRLESYLDVSRQVAVVSRWILDAKRNKLDLDLEEVDTSELDSYIENELERDIDRDSLSSEGMSLEGLNSMLVQVLEKVDM